MAVMPTAMQATVTNRQQDQMGEVQELVEFAARS
jgi:hypothetical protein